MNICKFKEPRNNIFSFHQIACIILKMISAIKMISSQNIEFNDTRVINALCDNATRVCESYQSTQSILGQYSNFSTEIVQD